MQKLVKNAALATNEWQLAGTDFDLAQLGEGKWLLPLELFLSANEQGKVDFENCGVCLENSDDAHALSPFLSQLQIIAINVVGFMDGRNFSQARILREQLDFGGEIRAVGNFIQDQLCYLSRCGFNAFLLPEDANIPSCIESLTDFTESYQAACDEPQPLFRRRA